MSLQKYTDFSGDELLTLFVEMFNCGPYPEKIVINREQAKLMAEAIVETRKTLKDYEGTEIWGFYEEEFPVYTNRQQACDISSIMSVAEANNLIAIIKKQREKLRAAGIEDENGN